MYRNPFETTIYSTIVLVAFIVATAQSEIQNHLFSSILVSNYDLFGTARDLTRFSLQ